MYYKNLCDNNDITVPKVFFSREVVTREKVAFNIAVFVCCAVF